MPIEIYVVRTDFSGARPTVPTQGALGSLVLRSLEESNSRVRFDMFETEGGARAAPGEVYLLLFEVKGSWREAPSHAVYAAWRVRDPTKARAFERSRWELFALRREVLATFAHDRLLKSLEDERVYLVLGLYGDEAGATRLCREHPRIQSFIKAHPAEDFSAIDLTGATLLSHRKCRLPVAYPLERAEDWCTRSQLD